MTTTPSSPTDSAEGPDPDGGAHPGPRVSREDIADLGRLRRTVGPDRRIGGVAGGLARHLDVDPLLVRVLLVVLALFGGAGLVLYLALWLFVPEDYTGRSVISTREDTRRVLLIVAAIVALVCLTGATFNDGSLWPLIVVAGGALVFLLMRERRGFDSHREPWAQRPTEGAGPAYGSSMTGWVGDDQTATTPPTGTFSSGGPQPPYGDYRTASYSRRPADPRRRGPILFWWVLATIAVVLGSLSMIDMAGADLPGSVYPATALAIIAAGLLLGAFWGRAGGLIFLGFLALVATGAATAADRFTDETRHVPTSASAVQDQYRIGAGTMVLDLSHVSDPARLDGRQIRVSGGAAQLVVVVPDDMDVAADAVIDGPGEAIVFNQRDGNIGLDVTGERDVQDEVGRLEIHAEVHVGEIDIVTPAEYALNDYGTRK
jgi:phage shock protein PspC (stress-responsive transcriptional regulator)